MQMKFLTYFFFVCSLILLVKSQGSEPRANNSPARLNAEDLMQRLRSLETRFQEHMRSAHPEGGPGQNNHRLARLEDHLTRLNNRMDGFFNRHGPTALESPMRRHRLLPPPPLSPGQVAPSLPSAPSAASTPVASAPVATAPASQRRKRQIYYDGFDGHWGDGYHGGWDYGGYHGGWYGDHW